MKNQLKVPGLPRIKKTRLNALINVCIFFLFIIMALSGIMLGHTSAATENAADAIGNLAVAGNSQGLWTHMHIITSVIFVLLVATHLALHFSYIKRLPRLVLGRRPQDG